MAVDQTSAPTHRRYDPLLDEAPRRKGGSNILIAAIIVLALHAALIFYLWKTRIQPHYHEYIDTAVKVDLVKPAPPPPPPPPPGTAAPVVPGEPGLPPDVQAIKSTIVFEGSFQSLRRFLAGLHNSRRLVSLVECRIGPGVGGYPVIDTTLTVTRYVDPPGAAALAPPPTGTAPKA